MAKAAALVTVGTLGVLAALDPPFTRADPTPGTTATVYLTQTETRTVSRRIEGRGAEWWRYRAVRNRRLLNATRATLRRQTRAVTSATGPSVREALSLARAVYGYDLTRRAVCESHLNPFAVNASGSTGLLQFMPGTWRSTPFGGFSIWSAYAQALAGGWMISRGRSGEWSCRL